MLNDLDNAEEEAQAGRLGGWVARWLGLRNGSFCCGPQCRDVRNIIRHESVKMSKQVISTFFFSEFLHDLWPLDHERLGCLQVLQDPGSEADFR